MNEQNITSDYSSHTSAFFDDKTDVHDLEPSSSIMNNLFSKSEAKNEICTKDTLNPIIYPVHARQEQKQCIIDISNPMTATKDILQENEDCKKFSSISCSEGNGDDPHHTNNKASMNLLISKSMKYTNASEVLPFDSDNQKPSLIFLSTEIETNKEDSEKESSKAAFCSVYNEDNTDENSKSNVYFAHQTNKVRGGVFPNISNGKLLENFSLVRSLETRNSDRNEVEKYLGLYNSKCSVNTGSAFSDTGNGDLKEHNFCNDQSSGILLSSETFARTSSVSSKSTFNMIETKHLVYPGPEDKTEVNGILRKVETTSEKTGNAKLNVAGTTSHNISTSFLNTSNSKDFNNSVQIKDTHKNKTDCKLIIDFTSNQSRIKPEMDHCSITNHLIEKNDGVKMIRNICEHDNKIPLNSVCCRQETNECFVDLSKSICKIDTSTVLTCDNKFHKSSIVSSFNENTKDGRCHPAHKVVKDSLFPENETNKKYNESKDKVRIDSLINDTSSKSGHYFPHSTQDTKERLFVSTFQGKSIKYAPLVRDLKKEDVVKYEIKQCFVDLSSSICNDGSRTVKVSSIGKNRQRCFQQFYKKLPVNTKIISENQDVTSLKYTKVQPQNKDCQEQIFKVHCYSIPTRKETGNYISELCGNKAHVNAEENHMSISHTISNNYITCKEIQQNNFNTENPNSSTNFMLNREQNNKVRNRVPTINSLTAMESVAVNACRNEDIKIKIFSDRKLQVEAKVQLKKLDILAWKSGRVQPEIIGEKTSNLPGIRNRMVTFKSFEINGLICTSNGQKNRAEEIPATDNGPEEDLSEIYTRKENKFRSTHNRQISKTNVENKSKYEEVFSVKGMQRAHLKTQTSKREYQRLQSRKQCTNKEGFGKHSKKLSIEKDLECHQCGKIFETRKHLTKHKIIHSNKSYECPKCNKRLKTKQSLTVHFKRHDAHCDRLYECTKCDYKSLFESNIIRHKINVHTEIKKMYFCSVCDKAFRRKLSLKVHLQIHTGKRYICEKCGRSYVTESNLKKHKAIHTGFKPHCCDICGKYFFQMNNLKLHIRTHIAAEKSFHCDVCKESFSRIGHLQRHMTKHTGEKRFICEFCGKKFSQRAHLYTHMNTHTRERKYTCDYCRKCFLIKTSLKIHLSIHSDAPHQFSCSQCGKTFRLDIALSKHIRTYHKAARKPYKCDHCEKAFHSSTALNDHIRIHSGIKPFTCSHCSKSFTQKSHLTQHVLRYTGGNKIFTCNLCGKSFTSKSYLVSHERSHTGIKPFECEKCNKSFASRGGLYSHVKRHNNDREYKCRVCGFAFNDSGDLRKHLRRHTGERRFTCMVCGFKFFESSELTVHKRKQHAVKESL